MAPPESWLNCCGDRTEGSGLRRLTPKTLAGRGRRSGCSPMTILDAPAASAQHSTSLRRHSRRSVGCLRGNEPELRRHILGDRQLAMSDGVLTRLHRSLRQLPRAAVFYIAKRRQHLAVGQTRQHTAGSLYAQLLRASGPQAIARRCYREMPANLGRPFSLFN